MIGSHIGSIGALLLLSGSHSAAESAKNGGIYRPVTSREVDQLKRGIMEQTQCSVEGIFDYHGEAGGLNDRLGFWRYGTRLNYKWTANSLVHFRATRTSYMTQGGVLDENGTN